MNSSAPPLPSLETLYPTLAFVPDLQPWRRQLEAAPRAHRISLDCYLLILQSLQQLGLENCSLLEMECRGGFFAFAFAVTIAAHVTAADADADSLKPLRQAREAYGLGHLEIRQQSSEVLLAAPEGQWDAVLFLAVPPETEALPGLLAALARITRRVVYVSSDSPDPSLDLFLSESRAHPGFRTARSLGRSCSTAGHPRGVWELQRS